MCSQVILRNAVCGDSDLFDRRFDEDHLTPSGGRKVTPGPARSASDINEQLSFAQVEEATKQVCLIPSGVCPRPVSRSNNLRFDAPQNWVTDATKTFCELELPIPGVV